MTSCGGTPPNNDSNITDSSIVTPNDTSSSQEDESISSEPENTTYQSVYDYHVEQLEAATPKLIKEFKKEAKKNKDGITGLAEISSEKAHKLADITGKGITEMAAINVKNGMKDNEGYLEWSTKLQDIYLVEYGKITKVYQDMATKR